MLRIMLFAGLLVVAQVAMAQVPVADPGELTPEQLEKIVDKSAKRAEVECLNRYTAAAALAGASVGNLLTRPGTLLKPGPLLAIALVIWAGIEIHDAIVAGKVRADCAAAGALAGLAVSYWYFQRVYKTDPAKSSSTAADPPPASPPAAPPGPGGPPIPD